jgi:hypothetical protein
MLQQIWALLSKFQCICCQHTEFVVQLNLTSIISREPTAPGLRIFLLFPRSYNILLYKITADISSFKFANLTLDERVEMVLLSGRQG